MNTNYHSITLIFALCIVMLQACSDNSSGSEGGETVELTGTIHAPDGSTPLAGATVYLPQGGVSKVIAGKAEVHTSPVEGIECQEPKENYSAFTCTTADGSFTLDVPTKDGETTLKISKGIFSFEQSINISGNNGELGAIVMPGAKESFNGRIAVVKGAFDRMQDILAKVGLGEVETEEGAAEYGQLVPGTEEFDIFNYPDELFEDMDGDGSKDLFNYDIVFINCGASEGPVALSKGKGHRHLSQKGSIDEPDILSEENRSALIAYVEEGGVLYTTDWAYDYVEQAFPSYIDFYGADEVAANDPEDMNAAEKGSANIETDGNILQNSMQAWLNNVDCYEGEGCLNNDGSIHITDFLAAWSVIEHPHDGADVTSWVEGQVQWGGGAGVRPLTLSFAVGEGSVFYSSYHTVESEYTPNWRPQERILQYLVFE
jgi:hypothetical protein